MVHQMLIASAVMGLAETGVEVTQQSVMKWLNDRGQNIPEGVVKTFFENFTGNLYASFQLIILTRVIRQADRMIEPFELDMQRKMEKLDRVFDYLGKLPTGKRGKWISKARGYTQKFQLKGQTKEQLVEEAKLNADIVQGGSLMAMGMSTGAGSVVAKQKGSVPPIPMSNRAILQMMEEFVNATKMG